MMKQPLQASTRVVFNTGILYAKMFITVGITLYSTRLVLNALGASDYGIFNLIGGVIGMLSFLNASMTVSTQRFLSYHQGTGNKQMQNKIFINSWILHIGIGVIIVVLLLIFMPFLFGGFLNIPPDRLSTAKTVYVFMIISVLFAIISVPFTASLNAHENMLWIAVVNIIESLCKLGIALLLIIFIQSQRLIIYGVLMAVLSFISFSLYAIFCLKRYDECEVKKLKIDKTLMKELGSFAGYTLFGTFAWVAQTQGLAVILNVFFGTIVNAAYGIGNQVSAQLSFFSTTMMKAINPQIMKSAGMDDRQRMVRLSMMACKFGFFLLSLFAIPIIFEMSEILKFWLKNVPENTVVFCSLILIALMIKILTDGLHSSIHAIGNIRKYQLYEGGIFLLNIPIAIVLFKLKLPPYSPLLSFIGLEIIHCGIRLYFAEKLVGLSIKVYFNRVMFKILIPVGVSILSSWLCISYFTFNFRFLFTLIISAICFLLSVYCFGTCKDEKEILNKMILKILKK